MFNPGRLPAYAGLLAAAFTVLPAASAHAAETVYPLTINSCGQDITFKQAPARTVSVGQSTTEVLISSALPTGWWARRCGSARF